MRAKRRERSEGRGRMPVLRSRREVRYEMVRVVVK